MNDEHYSIVLRTDRGPHTIMVQTVRRHELGPALVAIFRPTTADRRAVRRIEGHVEGTQPSENLVLLTFLSGGVDPDLAEGIAEKVLLCSTEFSSLTIASGVAHGEGRVDHVLILDGPLGKPVDHFPERLSLEAKIALIFAPDAPVKALIRATRNDATIDAIKKTVAHAEGEVLHEDGDSLTVFVKGSALYRLVIIDGVLRVDLAK